MQDFELFKAWVHAVIDTKMAEAFGQDALMEAVEEQYLEDKLKELVEQNKQQ